jgi:predicted Abi (CAAX) family protease
VSSDKGATGPLSEILAGLKRLPDMRAAIEALLLFLLVIAAGYWAASTGVLRSNPLSSRGELLPIWLSAFLVPALSEELIFRGWLRRGMPIAAVASLLAFIAWHPLQVGLNLPFARPEFLDPRFLSLVAWLGLACTLSRLRSGSIWPAVIIHWGVVVVWIALYAN